MLDTGMGNDVDDLMTLIMIHNLQKRAACELLPVTITKDHPQAAAFPHIAMERDRELLVMNSGQAARVREAIVQLSVEPPPAIP